MNHIYQHRRHNKNLLMVHLIFATKYRKALLFGVFRTDVKQYMFDARTEGISTTKIKHDLELLGRKG